VARRRLRAGRSADAVATKILLIVSIALAAVCFLAGAILWKPWGARVGGAAALCFFFCLFFAKREGENQRAAAIAQACRRRLKTDLLSTPEF
jgi:hypothetical protein